MNIPEGTDKPRGVILLVDDDKFLLDMYSMKFMQKGYAVEATTSSAQALAALRGGLKPTAMLFDVVMPGDDGFSLLRTVTEEHLAGGATLIALTNQSQDADRAQAEKLGVDSYWVKATMIPSEVVNMTEQEIAKGMKKTA
jgi:two-component system phosphate regulon response regulator OmpR